MIRYLALILLTLAVSGCGRSEAEQLAYQHAEEQYQINQRNAEQYRREGRITTVTTDPDADPVPDSEPASPPKP